MLCAPSARRRYEPHALYRYQNPEGILPLVPLFAGLSALGTLTGGAAAVANAVNTSKNAQKKLDESQRHNQTMEAIALGTICIIARLLSTL